MTPTDKLAALVACPFCGDKAVQLREHDPDMVEWGYIACSGCGARTRGKWGDLCPAAWQEIRDEWSRRTDAPALVGGGWRPIAEAPRDGTRIVLWWGGEVRWGAYLDNSHSRVAWQGWRVPSMERMPGGQPTHFLIPSPPESAP